ncbi:MAG TPA: DUF305 domain-containing protein [Saprospiraceae bacterium]|nr:DUF305 domain-containing protein [Saprospiraceae bacterium]HPI04791.1 DUF305 domain-containing protein [Saprospiraceae bacterium]
MKNLIFLIASIGVFGFPSCKDNDSEFQAHDENEMMGLMHDMMAVMDNMTPTNDPDQDWAMMMRAHHQGAISMANLELQKGDDAALRDMATEMINKQQAEIATLTAYLNSHTPHLSKPEFTQKMMEHMEHSEKDKDLQALTGDTDHDFAAMMFVHHESGIKMAELLLEYGEDNETRQLAEQVKEDQKQEVSELQDWLLNNKPY